MDILFVHVPKLNNYYRPIGEYIWINFMPMGLLALADFLAREGYTTEIVHLGVEWINEEDFSILNYVNQKKPKIVALPLHWHHQSYDVIECGRRIKEASPDVFLLLGGLTASFFHREIMQDFSWVDAIIRGEGEIPLMRLTEVIIKGGDLAAVPNLTWRKGEIIIENSLNYVASQDILNGLCFTNFSLLKNYQTYINWVLLPFFVKEVSKERNRLFFSLKTSMFPLPVGRGCPVNCTWCGGGKEAQSFIAGRRRVIFRDLKKVMTSIKEAINWGYETMHVCFDPYPHYPDYYLKLFSMIREENLKVDFFFESFGLPSKEFIDGFAQTFGSRSLLALSPESGSEEVRKNNKGYAYTNQELLDCLDYTLNKGVNVDLFFSLGLPFEREKDLEDTTRLITLAKRNFPNIQGIRTFAIEMEPGAPWQLQPEKFGIRTNLRTFFDFYSYHNEQKEGFVSFGYSIPGYFSDLEEDAEGEFHKRLQKIKCRSFCFIHPNARKSSSPFWGRMLCRTTIIIRRLGGWWRKLNRFLL
jgi:radical SAM superfamily enzyme YgiQ (UPF0313 family)